MDDGNRSIRLIRRCNIKEEDAPNYLSPPTSPINLINTD